MSIFGKTLSGIGNKIGQAFTQNYGKVRNFAVNAAQTAHKGIAEVRKFGGIADNALGTAQRVIDVGRGIPIIGAAASLLGSGVAQARNLVKLGNTGVDGLEKGLNAAEGVANAFDNARNKLKRP